MSPRRALVATVLISALSVGASAQEPDDASRAEALNDQGKALFSEQKNYTGAADKFRLAIALVPDARYFYNLCAALERLERYQEAIDACDGVFAHQPRPELAQKTGAKSAAIRQLLRAQSPSPPATQPGTTPPVTPTPDQPATTAEEEVESEAPGYRWTLGADLGLAVNSSVGLREYGRAGLALQIQAGLLISQKLRLGGLGYFALSTFPQRDDVVVSQPLTVTSLGVAAFWHKRLWKQLHLTPLFGLDLTALSVDTAGGVEGYGTLGVRLEAAVEWRFPGGHHVLRAVPFALNHYFPAGQITGDRAPAEDYGFDHGGNTWSILFGYCYRFEGPAIPGLNLE